MRKIAFHNLGCKVNAYETEVMIQQMAEEGYEIVDFTETADVYVINTCTVTNIADRKSRQMLHRAKKMNPEALVVAVGCYVQADPESVKKDLAVDVIIGNDQKSQLKERIRQALNGEDNSEVLDLKGSREYEPLFLQGSKEHTRAIMKIQDGCNQFCSYCLIPYVRGRVRSRKHEDVIQEAKNLASRGFHEIVVTGIHLSSYGLDLPEWENTKSDQEIYGTALRQLIRELAEIPGIERIRLGSLEPRIITKPFMDDLKACGKICPHFHLSLQSGCDSVLKRMNRMYTIEEYREGCRLIRETFEHAAITTDVIVGFPGETEEEFKETVEFLEEIQFYEMHVFPYSRRKGTRADRMPDQIPNDVKKQRSQILLEMTERHSHEFRKFYLGRNVKVLLEERMQHDGNPVFVGYNEEYVKFYVPAENHQAGDLVEIQVKEDNLAE